MAFTRRDSGAGSRGGKKFGGGGAKFGGGSKFGASRGGSKFGGGSRFGGGSKFGDRKPSFGGDRDGVRPPMFDAVCGECGGDARVPFRPNGSKPVLCSNCFKKDGGSGFSKPAYRESRPYASSGSSDRGVQDQLKEISKKLDAILDALDV